MEANPAVEQPHVDPTSIEVSYAALVVAASEFVGHTTEFEQAVAAVNRHLTRLHLGVMVWFEKPIDPQSPQPQREEPARIQQFRVGYTRLNGRWGLAVGVNEEEWHLNEAPVAFRLRAVRLLPDLLQHMVPATTKMSRRVQQASSMVREMVTAIESVKVEPITRRKAQ